MTARIVVLRALGLGDFLTGVPAYRALRRAFPEHELVLAAPAPLAMLTPLTGAVDALLATPGLQRIGWQGRAPDIAVNLHGRGPRSHALLDALAPRRRIGFTAPGWDGPEWSDDEHETDRWCRVLAHHGVAADPTDLLLPPPGPSPAAGAVVVHPGAAYGCRRWPAGRFATVARRLAADGHRIVVTGGTGEREIVQRVASDIGIDAGVTDLRQLAAIVAGAALVICGDTGVAHLATAFGTPSVLLFGPTPPDRWGPRTAGPHRVLWRPDQPRGDPRTDAPDPALLAITPADVLAAAAPLVAPRNAVR
jgi:ADP-heptose:LPS heptosyltransferase